MATVAWSYHFGSILHDLQDKVNPTLEYTAPYGLFGDQEIILIPLQGRDDETGVKISSDCEYLGCRRIPTSILFFLA